MSAPEEQQEPQPNLRQVDCREFQLRRFERMQSHSHGHSHGGHDHNHAPKKGWRLWTMIFLTGLFFVAELVAGYITKSLTLQSDAFHMLTDLFALIIALYAHLQTRKPPTDRMSFGWERSEEVGGLVNATFMLAICATLIVEAVQRFFKVEKIVDPNLLLIVGGAGLLINIIGLIIFCDHGDSTNLQGVFIHVLGDALGSVGVMISAFVIKFTNWKYKDYLDPALSLIIVLMLINASVRLFIKTVKTTMDATPDDIDPNEVRVSIMQIPGIHEIHELHIWQRNPHSILAMIHVVIESNADTRAVKQQVYNTLLEFDIFSQNIQIERPDEFPPNVQRENMCSYSTVADPEKRVYRIAPVFEHCVGCPHHFNDADAASHATLGHGHDHEHEHMDHDSIDLRRHDRSESSMNDQLVPGLTIYT